ncbi:hypothetical protein D3C81_1301260 [compost metagenome]
MQFQISLAGFVIDNAQQEALFALRHIYSINTSDDFHYTSVRQLKSKGWQQTTWAKIKL